EELQGASLRQVTDNYIGLNGGQTTISRPADRRSAQWEMVVCPLFDSCVDSLPDHRRNAGGERQGAGLGVEVRPLVGQGGVEGVEGAVHEARVLGADGGDGEVRVQDA